MAKVFTITEGLENMGALKTGGQGSVYKGRRIGEIITAVKLLPTPIHTESADDKNFIDFQNEVKKLQKVNEQPNPNVVKILASGITESGAFPFIEMEFIEGPELEELLKPPHDPLFTVKEVVKVATQLSGALAHCHRVDVKHGDIKSNNVKLNIHTGNYILLDFGLAVMSDEQRRTSLRHAGAIEFMAPEQNEGLMLFQTDVYSFGIILYELVAGQVPFPLGDRGQTARNMVMVAHMEAPLPDMLALRKKNMPGGWVEEKKEQEMHVPQWLISTIYKCLQKKPADRFENGIELHDYIILNSTLTIKNNELSADRLGFLQQENEKLNKEKSNLQSLLLNYQKSSDEKEKELIALKNTVNQKDAELVTLRSGATTYNVYKKPLQTGVSKPAFFALLFLTVGLAAFAAYSIFSQKNFWQRAANKIGITDSKGKPSTEEKRTNNLPTKEIQEKIADENNNEPISSEPARKPKAIYPPKHSVEDTDVVIDEGKPNGTGETATGEGDQYTVVASRAYFHNKPEESTRRNAFIVPWNNAILTALDDENGFVYVVFTNHLGQTSKGWLRKEDLKLHEE